MSKYLLTVEKVVNQQYLLLADSPEDAVEKYYDGDEMVDIGELTDSYDEGFVLSVEEYDQTEEILPSSAVGEEG